MLASCLSRLGFQWFCAFAISRPRDLFRRLGVVPAQARFSVPKTAGTPVKTTTHSLPPSNPLVAGASKLGSGGKGQYVTSRGFFPPAARLEVLRSRLAGNRAGDCSSRIGNKP